MKQVKTMDEQISRIRTAEETFNRAQTALEKLEQAWEDYLETTGDFSKLEKYLNSKERKDDVAADEAGELPADLHRGVLSQDGIWNLLERRDELTREIRSEC